MRLVAAARAVSPAAALVASPEVGGVVVSPEGVAALAASPEAAPAVLPADVAAEVVRAALPEGVAAVAAVEKMDASCGCQRSA